ncbi:hypothetical protein E2C01_051512 [Portunus trituberculatus]|uniref:Uncharacterized protein n=1 Tax=Portunus trituberculatus TaxID=210409 RepID=A0A5B7GF05_PORTR|nr:hypothetical protein [Portunus trituberculatus]
MIDGPTRVTSWVEHPLKRAVMMDGSTRRPGMTGSRVHPYSSPTLVTTKVSISQDSKWLTGTKQGSLSTSSLSYTTSQSYNTCQLAKGLLGFVVSGKQAVSPSLSCINPASKEFLGINSGKPTNRIYT